MELSVQNLYGLVIRSRLLSLDGAKTMFQRWQTEAKTAANDAGQFAKWMVANQFVTEYQASMLARGYADGFFLNQYKMLERIGQGRMAGVYKAMHQLGQTVAIKVLPPSKARDPQLLARFQREALLALRLKHPNVVRTYQTGEAGGLHYLVMEYLEGETLEDVLKRRRQLPPPEAVRVIYQAMVGLQHIHEQGLVHRDLKPANLMLVPAPTPGPTETTQPCTVKVLDIGLGRVLFDETVSERVNDPALTSEGALLGTPDYMSPEQARDARSADIRSDIYSLGCVLYQCLAGQPPFPDTNIISQMIRHATEPVRPLKQLNSAVPDGLQQIVNGLLAKDPNQRPPTPEHAAQALRGFLAAGGEPAQPLDADPRMRTYLTWLDTANRPKKGAPPVAQPSSAPPVAAAIPLTAPPGVRPPALPVPAPKIAASATRPTKTRKHSSKRRSKKQKRRTSAVALTPAPPGPSSEPSLSGLPPGFQVELVAASPPPAAPTSYQRLTRRDILMFGSGVLSTGAAIFLGWAVANLFRKKPPAEEPEPPADEKAN